MHENKISVLFFFFPKTNVAVVSFLWLFCKPSHTRAFLVFTSLCLKKLEIQSAHMFHSFTASGIGFTASVARCLAGFTTCTATSLPARFQDSQAAGLVSETQTLNVALVKILQILTGPFTHISYILIGAKSIFSIHVFLFHPQQAIRDTKRTRNLLRLEVNGSGTVQGLDDCKPCNCQRPKLS